jgi:hypothetical protein
MNRQPLAPRGQAVVELAIVVALFSSLLFAVMAIGIVGEYAIAAAHGARFSAFDCDSRPTNCGQSSLMSESKLRSTVILSAQREVLPDDAVDVKRWRSLQDQQHPVTNADHIRLEIDRPKVDGADKNLLEKLSSTFRSFSLKAGPAIFDLENPDHLVRSTVRVTLWPSSTQNSRVVLPSLALSSRVALVSDAWTAVDRSDLTTRIRRGESPSSLLDGAMNALYFPTKDLLMPVFDVVGLERGTDEFRGRFHNVDHDLPFANSRTNPVNR